MLQDWKPSGFQSLSLPQRPFYNINFGQNIVVVVHRQFISFSVPILLLVRGPPRNSNGCTTTVSNRGIGEIDVIFWGSVSPVRYWSSKRRIFACSQSSFESFHAIMSPRKSPAYLSRKCQKSHTRTIQLEVQVRRSNKSYLLALSIKALDVSSSLSLLRFLL